jgi:YVTN family beta-propeller protein
VAALTAVVLLLLGASAIGVPSARSAPPGGVTSVAAENRTYYVNQTLNVGSSPTAVVLDPITGVLYAVDSTASGEIALLNASSGTDVANVTVQSAPQSAAFNPRNGDIYVTTPESDGVTVIAGSAVIATISDVQEDPTAVPIVADPVNGDVYVASSGIESVDGQSQVTGEISVINGSTNHLTANLSLGVQCFVYAMTFDSMLDFVLAGAIGQGCDGVFEIQGSTNSEWNFVGSPIGNYPGALAFDPRNGHVYEGWSGTDLVSDLGNLQPSSNAFVWVGQSPDSLVSDESGQVLFSANSQSNNVSVINATTDQTIGSVTVGTSPDAAAFDPENNRLYVTNYGSGTISVIVYGAPPLATGLHADEATYWLAGITVGAVVAAAALVIFVRQRLKRPPNASEI